MTNASPDETSSYPLAAQIPLASFILPDFPAQASHLRDLTLTSDIKLDEYQSLLSANSSDADGVDRPPRLPQSITSLTLELFHLGFPAPFLNSLAKSLPNVKSLTLFSTLLDGLSDGSRRDAAEFFELLPLLQTLHVIDSFARPGFLKVVGEGLQKNARELHEQNGEGLKVVEISYTYRGHEDGDFLGRINGEEVPELLVPGVVGWSVNLTPAMVEGGESGLPVNGGSRGATETAPEGILPFASDSRAANALRSRFERLSGGSLKELKVLNLSLYTLRPHEIGAVVYSCAAGGEGSLVDLTISVLLEDGWWDGLLNGFESISGTLESLEIIGVPSGGTTEDGGVQSHAKTLLKNQKDELEELARAAPRLTKFEMSILRAKKSGSVSYVLQDCARKSVD